MAEEKKVDKVKTVKKEASGDKKVETPSMKKRGSKEEVYNGAALKTKGGLTKDKLIMNKRNKVVSKARADRGHQLYKDYVEKK